MPWAGVIWAGFLFERGITVASIDWQKDANRGDALMGLSARVTQTLELMAARKARARQIYSARGDTVQLILGG
ncbi:MAG: hypothetical protein ACJAU6_003529 [Alphaproteobacteria bacterium]|jgi:hypothetical protein